MRAWHGLDAAGFRGHHGTSFAIAPSMVGSKRLGILTGGGDAPGLNAAIRAVFLAAARNAVTCVGVEEGFEGLRCPTRQRILTIDDVRGIHRLGGTILGTTNRGNPLSARGLPGIDPATYAATIVENFHRLDLQALIVLGGDGTIAIAERLSQRGLPIVLIPKTIDHDVVGTAVTIGFDTAVACVTDAIDRLQATADAHRRIMVVEVMGRYAGWIALHGGLAGGADAILIPELPFDMGTVAEHIQARDRLGARYHIVVAAEGAFPAGGTHSVTTPRVGGREERLGGIGERVATALQTLTGHEARWEVLGHLQRGGAPSGADRVAAARFGAFAVALVKNGEFGVMTASQPPDLVALPLDQVAGRTHLVARDNELVRAARHLGICLGSPN